MCIIEMLKIRELNYFVPVVSVIFDFIVKFIWRLEIDSFDDYSDD